MNKRTAKVYSRCDRCDWRGPIRENKQHAYQRYQSHLRIKHSDMVPDPALRPITR